MAVEGVADRGHTKLEARFGFWACSLHETMTRQLYGPHLTRIWYLENISSASCWDPGPMVPRCVPWDVLAEKNSLNAWCYFMHFGDLLCNKCTMGKKQKSEKTKIFFYYSMGGCRWKIYLVHEVSVEHHTKFGQFLLLFLVTVTKIEFCPNLQ